MRHLVLWFVYVETTNENDLGCSSNAWMSCVTCCSARWHTEHWWLPVSLLALASGWSGWSGWWQHLELHYNKSGLYPSAQTPVWFGQWVRWSRSSKTCFTGSLQTSETFTLPSLFWFVVVCLCVYALAVMLRLYLFSQCTIKKAGSANPQDCANPGIWTSDRLISCTHPNPKSITLSQLHFAIYEKWCAIARVCFWKSNLETKMCFR